MATPFTDVEAMRSEIVRLTQAVETLKKDAPSVLSHRKPAYYTDDEESSPPRRCNAPPSLQRYDEYGPTQSNLAKRKEIPARRFTGKEPITDYIKQFELTAKHNRWDDEDKVTSLLCALDGEARSILAEIDNLDQTEYAEIKHKLLQRFGPTQHPEVHEQALHDLRLTRGQGIRELTPEINRLTKLAYPDFEPAARNRLAINALLNAIPDKDITFYIKDKNPISLEDVCVLYERYKVLTGHSTSHKPAAVRGVQPKWETPSPQLDSTLMSSLLKQKEEQQQQLRELTNAVSMLVQTQQATLMQQPQSYPTAPPQQWVSNAAELPPPQRATTEHPRPSQQRTNFSKPPPGPCPRCKQTGHWRRECTAQLPENASGPMPAPSNRSRVPPRNP